MIQKCITRILEPLGFIQEDEDRWVADFICDYTGNFLTIVTDPSSDESGVPLLRFSVCDECGTLVNTLTLDQLLVSIDDCLKLVEPKSDKSYEVVYNVKIQVPVHMDKVTDMQFKDCMVNGCDSEEDVAKMVGRETLYDYFTRWVFNVLECECEKITECDKF